MAASSFDVFLALSKVEEFWESKLNNDLYIKF